VYDEPHASIMSKTSALCQRALHVLDPSNAFNECSDWRPQRGQGFEVLTVTSYQLCFSFLHPIPIGI
jgi:hypothetical protein